MMVVELLTYTLMSWAGISPVAVSPTQLITPLPKYSPTPTHTPTPTPTHAPTPLPTATPTPTVLPTPLPIVTSNDLESLFSKYSQQYSVDSELLKRIAKCESGFNSSAENGPYVGMFQFAETTWVGVRGRMGENTDATLRKNAEEAIKTAAFMIGQGGQRAWANCL